MQQPCHGTFHSIVSQLYYCPPGLPPPVFSQGGVSVTSSNLAMNSFKCCGQECCGRSVWKKTAAALLTDPRMLPASDRKRVAPTKQSALFGVKGQSQSPALLRRGHESSVSGDNNTLVTITSTSACDGTFPRYPTGQFPKDPAFRAPARRVNYFPP